MSALPRLRVWRPQDSLPDVAETIVILSEDLQVEVTNAAWGDQGFMPRIAPSWHDALLRAIDRSHATAYPQSITYETVDGRRWDCRLWPLPGRRLAVQAFPTVPRASRRQGF